MPTMRATPAVRRVAAAPRALLTALLLPSAAAPAGARQPPVFRVGDAVEVKSRIDTTWARGRVVEASPDVYKVQLDGEGLYLATWHNVNRLRRPGERERPYVRPALAGSQWLQTSVTTARGTVETRATVPVHFARDGRWSISTPVSYGSGVSLLGRGTYRLAGSRLVMTRTDGTLYGDFDVRWDDAARSVVLSYRNGGGSMRLLSTQGL